MSEFLGNIKGPAGTDGKSAYAIAVEHGFTGTEDEWIESLENNEEVIDARTDANGIVFDVAGDATRALSSMFTAKVELSSPAAVASTGTAGYQSFHDNRVVLFTYNKSDGYAFVRGNIGVYSEIKGEAYRLIVRNESANDQALTQNLEVLFSVADSWGGTSYYLIVATITLDAGEEKSIPITIPESREGWDDTDTVRLIIRDQATSVGIDNDNAIRFYLFREADQTDSDTFDTIYETFRGNAELVDTRSNGSGALFDKAGDAVRAISDMFTPKFAFSSIEAFAGNSTVIKSAESFYENRVGLFNFNIPDSSTYAFVVGYMGEFSSIKGNSYSFHVRNESSNNQNLENVQVLLSAVSGWGTGSYYIITNTFNLDGDENKIVTVDVPASRDGWDDTSIIRLVVRQNNPTVGLGNDNALRFYLTDVQTEYEGYGGYYASTTARITADDVTESLRESLIKEILASSIIDYNQQITCWGDSLTAGGGWTTRLADLSGMTVNNAGTGGESAKTIMARQGGDVMIVNNITIPATTDPVIVASMSTDGGIATQLGNIVTPLLRSDATAHINPCYIGDVEGDLAWTGVDYTDTTGTWTFTRAEAGAEVAINRPTALRTSFDINRNKDIMVIFMGQNGGYDNNDDLINMHRLMIDHNSSLNKQFVILGLSSGDASTRADYESTMRTAFGRRFISLREYLSQYGLDDAGITPTEEDAAAMATGTVPPSLLSDNVHFNDAAKTVIGNMLYKKMRELNILS